MELEREEEEEDADQRREVAMASSSALRPNFKPKKGLTEAQISKFQELHKRRLQIKSKTKANKRSKGPISDKHRSNKKKITETSSKCTDQEPSESAEENTNSPIISQSGEDSVGSQRRRKLYWGLDVKERWERKSNM